MMRNNLLAVLRENAAEIRNTADALSVLREAQIAALAEAADAYTDTTALFRTVFGDAVGTAEHASFCRHLLFGETDCTKITALLPESTPLGELYDSGDAAYPQNPFTDAAFQKFAKAGLSLRALAQPSFNAACEEVYHGRCQYCILPLHNTEDGFLTSFSHLRTKYELKILRTCDIASDDGNSVIRFALLRRGVVPHVPKNGYFEIGIILPKHLTVGTFLTAAEAIGAHAEHLRTVPLAFASGLTSLAVTFHVTKECMAPLMLYLRTALDGYTIDGIYEDTET